MQHCSVATGSTSRGRWAITRLPGAPAGSDLGMALPSRMSQPGGVDRPAGPALRCVVGLLSPRAPLSGNRHTCMRIKQLLESAGHRCVVYWAGSSPAPEPVTGRAAPAGFAVPVLGTAPAITAGPEPPAPGRADGDGEATDTEAAAARAWADREGVEVVLCIHAFKTGKLLLPNGWGRPYGVIFGGTDLNQVRTIHWCGITHSLRAIGRANRSAGWLGSAFITARARACMGVQASCRPRLPIRTLIRDFGVPVSRCSLRVTPAAYA